MVAYQAVQEEFHDHDLEPVFTTGDASSKINT